MLVKSKIFNITLFIIISSLISFNILTSNSYASVAPMLKKVKPSVVNIKIYNKQKYKMIHTWKIYDLKRTTSDGLVTNVTYACESSYDNSSTRSIGEITLSGSPSEAGFIPYEDLTETEVLGWVNANIDEAAVQTANSASIATQIIRRAAITSSNGTPW